MKLTKYLLTITFGIPSLVCAYAPTNFYRPFEVDFRANELEEKQPFRIGVFSEYGTTDESHDLYNKKHGVLQLYNQKESSVAMLLGAPEGSEIDKLARTLGISAATITSDNSRGQFVLTGEYEELNTVMFAKYRLPIHLDGTFELSIFAPIKKISFDDVCWADQTKSVLSEDKAFKEDVSSKIGARALELGCLNINANGFSKTGMGDLAIMLGWGKTFMQQKEYLKKVRIQTYVGVSVPTGEKRDINQSLALPLGNDGAWGIPASLGLDLDFIYHLRAGVDLNFFGLFDTSGTFRMKTSRHQTDFLLLHKGEATKSQGPTWKFTLYGQAKKIVSGLSAMVSYHFLKHDEDRLSPRSYTFDHEIVNSAQSLKEWSSHSFVFQAAYEPFQKSKLKPQISAFYKLPVAGKRVILADTFGGQISFTF